MENRVVAEFWNRFSNALNAIGQKPLTPRVPRPPLVMIDQAAPGSSIVRPTVAATEAVPLDAAARCTHGQRTQRPFPCLNRSRSQPEIALLRDEQ